MDKRKVIEAINRAVRMELTSVFRYLDFSFRVFGPTREPVVEHSMDEAKESLDHATMLGEKIVALGGRPAVEADSPKAPDGETVDDLLRMPVDNEKAALSIYSENLGMVQEERHLRALFENQILAEQEHLEALSKMLRR